MRPRPTSSPAPPTTSRPIRRRRPGVPGTHRLSEAPRPPLQHQRLLRAPRPLGRRHRLVAAVSDRAPRGGRPAGDRDAHRQLRGAPRSRARPRRTCRRRSRAPPPVVDASAPRRHVASWIVGGIGAGLLVAALATGVTAHLAYNDVVMKCGGFECNGGDQSLRNEVGFGRALTISTDVFLGIGERHAHHRHRLVRHVEARHKAPARNYQGRMRNPSRVRLARHLRRARRRLHGLSTTSTKFSLQRRRRRSATWSGPMLPGFGAACVGVCDPSAGASARAGRSPAFMFGSRSVRAACARAPARPASPLAATTAAPPPTASPSRASRCACRIATRRSVAAAAPTSAAAPAAPGRDQRR